MNDKIFADFPDLSTTRCDLRQVQWQDLDMVLAFNSDLRVLRYVARDPYQTEEQAQEKIQGFLDGYQEQKGIWWTFIERSSGQAMGYGGLFEIDSSLASAEIGYGLMPEFWGRGFMTEIVAEMVRMGFEDLALSSIHALVVPGNEASEQVLLRQGFQPTGLLKDHSQARGQSFDMNRFEVEVSKKHKKPRKYDIITLQSYHPSTEDNS